MYAYRALSMKFEGECLGFMSREKLIDIAGARWEKYVRKCAETGFDVDAAMQELHDAAVMVLRYRFWRE